MTSAPHAHENRAGLRARGPHDALDAAAHKSARGPGLAAQRASKLAAKSDKDLAAKAGGSDLEAVADALTASPTHDANCPLCATGGHGGGPAFKQIAAENKASTGELECPGLKPGTIQKGVQKVLEKQKKNAPGSDGKKSGEGGGGDAKKGGDGDGGGDKKKGGEEKGAAGKQTPGAKEADEKKKNAPPSGDGKTKGGGGAKNGGSPDEQKAALRAVNDNVRAMVARKLGAVRKDGLHAGANSWGNPAGFPDTLGLTRINRAGFVPPVIDFDVVNTPASGATAASSTVKFKRTAATDAIHPCTSAPAADTVLGTQAVPDGKGGNITCDVVFRVTPAYAQKIWNAEDEHLADLQRAYDISLKKAADEINALVARSFTAATEADAKKLAKDELATKLPAKLGTDHTQYADVVARLCRLSGSGRDALDYHSFGTNEPTTDLAAKKIITDLNDGDTQIGTHTSASVIDYAKL